jgi:hypothetical protein
MAELGLNGHDCARPQRLSLASTALWKKVEQEAANLAVSVRPLGAQRDSFMSSRNRLQSCDIGTATRVLPFGLTPSPDRFLLLLHCLPHLSLPTSRIPNSDETHQDSRRVKGDETQRAGILEGWEGGKRNASLLNLLDVYSTWWEWRMTPLPLVKICGISVGC